MTNEQLKRVIKNIVKENITIGNTGGYYSTGKVFSFDGEVYRFSPAGWDFDTKSQLEAAALLSTANKPEYYDNPEFKKLPVTTPNAKDIEDAVYWMTGGNRMWRFHEDENLNSSWDECYEEVVEACMSDVQEVVNNSKSFYDLVNNFRAKRDAFMFDLYEDCADLFDSYDEDEQLQESVVLKQTIKESLKKVLKEGTSDRHYEALKPLLNKAFSGLSDNEKVFLYDMFNEYTWDVVYAAMNILQPARKSYNV